MTLACLPADSAALAVGADEVAACLMAEAAARGLDLTLIRTASRGAMFLEPLLEVILPNGGRAAYGPVAPADVPGLLEAGCLSGGAHPLAQGRPEDIPYLARQTRWLFAQAGRADPLSWSDFLAAGGLEGLRAALAQTPEALLAELETSNLRGRGGAGFPTATKWRTVRDTPADAKYIVCNADEGDSGTFADRMAMEGEPFQLLEGMVIAAYAMGARQGFLYLRSEYPRVADTLNRAVAIARANGMLGPDILGSGLAFDVAIRIGAGAYICGEETALLESA